jgi:hypothetical protein
MKELIADFEKAKAILKCEKNVPKHYDSLATTIQLFDHKWKTWVRKQKEAVPEFSDLVKGFSDDLWNCYFALVARNPSLEQIIEMEEQNGKIYAKVLQVSDSTL